MLATPTRPGESAFAITKSDSTVFAPTRGLYVGVSGDVAVTIGGVAVTFKNLVAGVVHPLAVTQVLSTGTGATDIVGVR